MRHEVGMPERAAELAVRHGFEPDFDLLVDDALDFRRLDFPQLICRNGTFLELFAGFVNAVGAQ